MPEQGSFVPIPDAVNRMAIARASELLDALGKALPCYVVAMQYPLVMVRFATAEPLPNVTIPIQGSDWLIHGLEPGDPGVTVQLARSASGVTSSSGARVVDTAVGNLSSLAFVPVASNRFMPQSGVTYVRGTQGCTVSCGSSTITVSPSTITLSCAGKSIQIDSSGVTIDGILFDSHVHGGVQSGSSNTTGPQS